MNAERAHDDGCLVEEEMRHVVGDVETFAGIVRSFGHVVGHEVFLTKLLESADVVGMGVRDEDGADGMWVDMSYF